MREIQIQIQILSGKSKIINRDNIRSGTSPKQLVLRANWSHFLRHIFYLGWLDRLTRITVFKWNRFFYKKLRPLPLFASHKFCWRTSIRNIFKTFWIRNGRGKDFSAFWNIIHTHADYFSPYLIFQSPYYDDVGKWVPDADPQKPDIWQESSNTGFVKRRNMFGAYEGSTFVYYDNGCHFKTRLIIGKGFDYTIPGKQNNQPG